MAWPEPLSRWWHRTFGPKTLGQRGEAAAVRYLKRLGYTIIERGSHIRRGEIDLIAVDGRTVVFVEVKTRSSHDAGHPADAVDDRKQDRLTRMALIYLKRHGLMDCSARFDVVAITWPTPASGRPTIEHYKNAFEGTGRWQMFS